MNKYPIFYINILLISIIFLSAIQLGSIQANSESIGFLQESKSSLPKLKVFAYPSIRNANENIKNIPDPVMLAKVKKLLNLAEVDYEIIILPWARILREAHTNKNFLIVALGHTLEREEQFHWIQSLRSVKLQLISRRDKTIESLSKEQIIGGDFWALCDAGSAQCKLLVDFGFFNNRIVKVADMSSVQKASIVERGRVDFMITEYESLKEQMEAVNLSANNLIPLLTLDQVDSFLAAGLEINPDILKRLHEAVNTLNCVDQ